jgi:hypothetical protein
MRRQRFSWNLVNAFRARSHLYARIWDTTARKRRQWTALQAARHGSEEFGFTPPGLGERFSFAVLGDTGEGDASQRAVAERLLETCADTDFAVIASDVVYPVGRTRWYRERFYEPYRDYPGDVFAVPGNHDWYDSAIGFMIHFCDTNRHYRRPVRILDEEELTALRRIRCNRVFQPHLYFTLDAPGLRLVAIDTGIRGRIDADQLAWLRRVSADPRPKVLVLGRPIYADGEYRERLREVDAVVREGGYVLVVAGDTHNFQRYRIPTAGPGGRGVVWHLVAGGGGAYLTRTHRIPLARDMELPVALEHEPDDFTCYPSREASRLRVRGLRARLPDWLVDRDGPPFWRSLVRVDVREEDLRVRVFGIRDTGPEDRRRGPVLDWEVPLRSAPGTRAGAGAPSR